MIGTQFRGSSKLGSAQLNRPEPPLLAWSLKPSQWPDLFSSDRSSLGLGIRITDADAKGARAEIPSNAASTRDSVTLPRIVPATNTSDGMTLRMWSRRLWPRRGVANSSQPPTHTATIAGLPTTTGIGRREGGEGERVGDGVFVSTGRDEWADNRSAIEATLDGSSTREAREAILEELAA